MHLYSLELGARIRKIALGLFLGIALVQAGVPAAFAQPYPDLTTVRQIRDLSPERAAAERPVRLQGVVTAVSGWKSSFFFQDNTSGISVDRPDSNPELKAGQLVELVGVSEQGKFAPVVKARSVKVLGMGTMPTAKLAGLGELAGGALDSQWVKIQGVVHRAEVKKVWGRDVLALELDIGGSTLANVRIRDFAKDGWQHLPASTISLRGVCGTVFNDKRQFIALRFFVPALDEIKVLTPGPMDLFDRPLTELSKIGSFRPGGGDSNLIRIRGTVTYLQGDGKVYLQSGSEGVLVQTNHEAALTEGEGVEVVGYPRDGDYSPYLEAAVLRPMSAARQVVNPPSVRASDFIVDRDGFPSSPYDSSLVRVSGFLRQVIHGSDDEVLFLQDGTTVFTARMASSVAKRRIPEIGSLIEVTGICGTRVDSAHDPRGFRVLLRSVSDITVLRGAPWWSAEHAKEIVMIMAVALAVMFLVLVLYQREATLRQLSLSDPLTGVHNRRGFTLLAEQQWQLVLRRKTSLLVFYIDLDKFKEINDSLGHKQGDIALQRVANILRNCFRKSDIIGRMGGDEFAVMTCDAAVSSTVELEHRLRQLVAQSNREFGGAFELSLSIGILLCDSSMSGSGVEDLLAHADELMYEQKMGRRSLADAPAQAVVVT
ncbi:diguanylate cyclase (GGDEF)-like protein [Granulicella aggregans]|uniref:diguanylate cyclase n=1 Tax=Granulicella aggregans TaxID=474949 RepID=A0A7W7ZE94_9BACT|nr:GGDEF domain-containing protein [Granulicella aggregans]MBB5058268.1 diguanylate cyclase (GGDEF)-like protein [Granulicella aggregans]